MLITRLSCFLWKLFSFFWSLCDNPQVPQLYKEVCFWLTIDTGVAFFYIVLLFDVALFDSSFLLFISSRSPSFDPNVMTFLHSFPFLFPFFLMVVFSVLSSLTSIVLLANMVFHLWYIASFFYSFLFVAKVLMQELYNNSQNIWD